MELDQTTAVSGYLARTDVYYCSIAIAFKIDTTV